MKKKIQVKYRSVFKYVDHSETIIKEGQGYLEHFGSRFILFFQDGKEDIKIECENDDVILQHGQSMLKMKTGRKILNQYQTAYGNIDMTIHLIKIEIRHGIKMKYQIFDRGELLSDVYMIINYVECEDENNQTVIN